MILENCIYSFIYVSPTATETERFLIENLFKNYNPNVRPAESDDEAVFVSMNLTYILIQDMASTVTGMIRKLIPY